LPVVLDELSIVGALALVPGTPLPLVDGLRRNGSDAFDE
jgi:hypothetical protein